MIKKCIICNNEFDSFHTKKTCSDDCRKQRNKYLYKNGAKRLRERRIKDNFYTDIPKTKICYVCKQEKEINFFANDKYQSDKHSYDCYTCRQKRKKLYDDTKEAKIVRRSRENIRRKEDPNFKLLKNIRSAIWRSIKNPIKKNKLISHLFYSVTTLKEHLENQFDENMNWDNYGSYWHIDHIKPVDAFEIEIAGDIEFNKCWDLNNLRPLEAKENIRKGNKIINVQKD